MLDIYLSDVFFFVLGFAIGLIIGLIESSYKGELVLKRNG
jgi:hypothetical protein